MKGWMPVMEAANTLTGSHRRPIPPPDPRKVNGPFDVALGLGETRPGAGNYLVRDEIDRSGGGGSDAI